MPRTPPHRSWYSPIPHMHPSRRHPRRGHNPPSSWGRVPPPTVPAPPPQHTQTHPSHAQHPPQHPQHLQHSPSMPPPHEPTPKSHHYAPVPKPDAPYPVGHAPPPSVSVPPHSGAGAVARQENTADAPSKRNRSQQAVSASPGRSTHVSLGSPVKRVNVLRALTYCGSYRLSMCLFPSIWHF